MTSYKTALPEALIPYIEIVEKEKHRSCAEQKKLVKFVKKVFKNEELKYDEEQINKYLSYQKYFPFKLFEWEVFCFVLHNCIFKTNAMPRFPDLFIFIGRGGGKNGYLSFEDFCLITETNGIEQYDIDICANSEEQAKTSFDEIYNILENPKYRKKFEKNFRWTKTEIQNKKTCSKIKFRTNNPKGKDGLRSGKVDFDEPHAYENWDNINVFTTGLGKKPHPRRTYVSTNGDVRDGPLDQLVEKSLKILNGEISDNGFLPFICRLDSEKEVDDFRNWEKANPSLPYLPTLMEEMKIEYADYILDPVINSAFMTKRMNRAKGRQDREVTSWENILATNKEMIDLSGKTCVVGIDFAKTTDMVSVVAIFKVDEKIYIIHHSWFCLNSLDKRRIKIPLDQMAERGFLTLVDDVEVSATLIADYISELQKKYNVLKIAVDSYRYSLLSRALAEIGFSAREKTIKLVRPSDIMLVQPKINSWFINQKMIWGDDPLMRWFTNNTKLVPAKNNNYVYGKIEPKSRKTDGFFAFVAAATLEEEIPEIPENLPGMFFEPIFF